MPFSIKERLISKAGKAHTILISRLLQFKTLRSVATGSFILVLLGWTCVRAGTSRSSAATLPGGRDALVPTLGAQGSPSLHIDYFGAEHGYTVGRAGVGILCVVHNVGAVPLLEKTLRLNCYTLAGLDYTTGETRPPIPALKPGQSAAFRWRLDPSAASGPLVAGVVVESIAAGANPVFTPSVTVAVIPRFRIGPRDWEESKSQSTTPWASAEGLSARVGNDRVIARVKAAEGGQPVLFLAGREGNAWREVAAATPLALVRSGEEGQTPWWETFRWQSASVSNSKDSAELTLSGTVGDRWKAEFVIEARRATGVLNAHLRLAPRRALRLYGVQYPRLLGETDPKATGSLPDDRGLLLTGANEFFSDSERIAAQHLRSLTYGIAWPSGFSLPGWQSHGLPTGDVDYRPVMGARAEVEERGEIIVPGQAVQFPMRIFSLGPSDTVRDALRAVMP